VSTGKRNSAGPLLIIGILFFVFGFITWLSSVLIPYLQLACELDNFESYLVAFAFYIAYLVMAFPSTKILNVSGFKNGMAVGLVVMAVGSLLFVPAALTRTYSLFLIGLFIQGAGMALLQTASNPYVTILGPRESAAKRISIMGVCNGIAGVISPAILGAIVLNDTDNIRARVSTLSASMKAAELTELASRVITPYIVIVIALALLAILVYYSGLPEIDAEDEEPVSATGEVKKSILQFPHLLLGVITLFFYVGVEVIAGNTIISYGSYQNIPIVTAKFFTSLTLVCMLIGYIIGIICIPRYFSQEKALKLSAVAGILFALAAMATGGYVSVFFIALLGLANSLMWPSIWPLAIAGLGRFTRVGSSLLVMAIAGGAVVPLLYGKLADHLNPKQAYWIVIPCYLLIWYYANWGHKAKN
jgi:glucose/galactose transporter